jgi:hypothetical protein
MRLLVLSIFFFFFSFSFAQAQVKKILHQSFEIEGIDNVKLDFAGGYDIVAWAGNSILIETNIELYSASRDIYNHFKKEGRYDVAADTAINLINLRSVDKERKPIRTSKGECFEIVRVRILIPEDFNIMNKTTLARKEPSFKLSDQ